jgi:hypothetical protein
MAFVSLSAKPFTDKQGQYLAFIYAYTRLNRRPPAEIDMQLLSNDLEPTATILGWPKERSNARQPI